MRHGSEGEGPQGDYLLNAYVTENLLFIGHEKVRDKENGIPAIPRLLDRLEIKGATVSIDAMGTQVDIAERILSKEGHYFLAVKENQGTRYYISDEDFPSGAYYGALARGHWAVENGMHWHLDVTCGEDGCRASKDNAAQNLSLIRKLMLQLVKSTNDRLSVRKRMIRASMDKDYLRTLLKNYGF